MPNCADTVKCGAKLGTDTLANTAMASGSTMPENLCGTVGLGQGMLFNAAARRVLLLMAGVFCFCSGGNQRAISEFVPPCKYLLSQIFLQLRALGPKKLLQIGCKCPVRIYSTGCLQTSK